MKKQRWDLYTFLESSERRRAVLEIIYNAGKPISPMQIRDYIDIPLSNISRILTKLANEKLILDRTPTIRRLKLYEITEKGKSIMKTINTQAFHKNLLNFLRQQGYTMETNLPRNTTQTQQLDAVIQKNNDRYILEIKTAPFVTMRDIDKIIQAKNCLQETDGINKAVIATLGHYTEQIKKQADANQIKLWDSKTLQKMGFKDTKNTYYHSPQTKQKKEPDDILQTIKELSHQHKLALFAVLLLEKKGVTDEPITTKRAYEIYKELCIKTGDDFLSKRKFTDMILDLAKQSIFTSKIITRQRQGERRVIRTEESLSTMVFSKLKEYKPFSVVKINSFDSTIKFAKCPRCGLEARGNKDIDRVFGYRVMIDGKIRINSWCKTCRHSMLKSSTKTNPDTAHNNLNASENIHSSTYMNKTQGLH